LELFGKLREEFPYGIHLSFPFIFENQGLFLELDYLKRVIFSLILGRW